MKCSSGVIRNSVTISFKRTGQDQMTKTKPNGYPARAGAGRETDAVNMIYGLGPVLEALRAGGKKIEHLTIAEGARHERLRELLDLAKEARVPLRRVPKLALDRTLPGDSHPATCWFPASV